MFDVDSFLDAVVKHRFPSFQFRKGQREAATSVINAYINNKKKYVLLDAPTGSGKSWLARIIAECMVTYYKDVLCLDESTEGFIDSVFLTKTIALQHQYLRDFKDMRLLKGASNYACHTDNPPPILPKLKHHGSCKYTRTDGKCEYAEARNLFKNNRLKTLNYAFYFTAHQFYPANYMLIADEAHALPDYLIGQSAATVNFSRLGGVSKSVHLSDFLDIAELNRVGLKFSHVPQLIEFCIKAAEDLAERYKEAMETAEEMDKAGNPGLAGILKDVLGPLEANLNWLSQLGSQLYELSSVDSKNMIIEKAESERDVIWTVTPLFVTPSSLNVVNKSRNILLMSGTIKRVAKELDLNKDDYEVVKMDYTYPLENRPFIRIDELPAFNYNTRELVFGKYVEFIDKFLDDTDASGIIHTSSYKNAEDLLKMTRHKSRIYIPTKDEVRDIAKVVRPGRVIASPAILEGVDFHGDMAAFQIFMKVPYPSLAGAWVQMKKEVDDGWYDYTTLLSIIQGAGRAIRSADDFAVTLMLDPSFDRLLKRTVDVIPEWFVKTLN